MAVEVAELGSWRGDFARDEISYSETFRTIFDLPPGTMLRRPDIYRYIHPDDREEVIARSKDAVERGVPYEFEYRVLRTNGTVRWVTAKGRIERSPDGANLASLGVVMDITERKQAQEVLKNRLMQERQAEELMRSNAELQQFAYVAAHDLQEPLRMVASYTQLLAQRYKGHLDADADDFIAFAVDGAHRMQALIADLLAYCRVETTGRQFQETSSGDALKQALHNLQGTIEGSGGVVTMDPLPVVVGDEAQLIQLFQNVVGNAIKYRGTEPPRVHVTASRKAGEWVFMVRDNGIGIDPQYFEKIFVMFQRLHRRDEYSGTGIGLSLCKKIVERHDGRIWVESSPGIGSTFFIALPEVRPT
jgi:light-regulated signal transduction histidine kinase (bacteriophytochrome)